MSRQNKEKPQRKIVIIIVEGHSDKTLLEVSLSQFFEQKYGNDTIVKFGMFERDDGKFGTDITSLYGSNPDKIEMLINKKIIFPVLDPEGLYPRRVAEIVHIIDTDGAFISDEKIIPYTTEEQATANNKVHYCEDHISAFDCISIQERNQRKVANIKRLLEFCKTGFPIRKYYNTESHGNKISSKDSVVTYSVYFFSCNMDHFTSNEMNWHGSKTALVENFLHDHGDGFLELKEFVLKTDPVISSMDYSTSWDYIMMDCNSLNRHSNIGVMLNSLNE